MSSHTPLIIKISAYLNSLSKKVFSEKELSQKITDFAQAINSPIDVDVGHYIDYLVDKSSLQRVLFKGNNTTKEKFVLVGGSKYEIAASAKELSYISHLSAAYIHQLLNDESKLIYVSVESPQRTKQENVMEQNAIDKAFDKPQRISNAEIAFGHCKLILLTGQYSKRAGIVKTGNYYITTLERTLIDMTVRPAYSGGTINILNAYRKALHMQVDLHSLIRIYNEIEFIYPYHQSIGFYLERAGYKGEILNALRNRPMKFTFYLDYAISDKVYSKDWNLYYPSQFDS